MADATIELLKGYEPKKMEFPAVISEKLDGVPVFITMQQGALFAYTRQGEELKSIFHIIEHLQRTMHMDHGAFLVGELYIKDVPFKEISGKVRKHAPAPDLTFNIFDGNLRPDLYQRYADRLFDINYSITADGPVQVIPYRVVRDAATAENEFDFHMKLNPKSEGMVLHSCAKVWSPGKRCWGTQRMKPQPTLDLMVVGYEEAVSQTGQRLGMVGRINVEYIRNDRSRVIGVGPGAMTHDERRQEWAKYIADESYDPDIIEVKYMTDDTYDALRQPTFVRFRPDKTVGDVHHVG